MPVPPQECLMAVCAYLQTYDPTDHGCNVGELFLQKSVCA